MSEIRMERNTMSKLEELESRSIKITQQETTAQVFSERAAPELGAEFLAEKILEQAVNDSQSYYYVSEFLNNSNMVVYGYWA